MARKLNALEIEYLVQRGYLSGLGLNRAIFRCMSKWQYVTWKLL